MQRLLYLLYNFILFLLIYLICFGCYSQPIADKDLLLKQYMDSLRDFEKGDYRSAQAGLSKIVSYGNEAPYADKALILMGYINLFERNSFNNSYDNFVRFLEKNSNSDRFVCSYASLLLADSCFFKKDFKKSCYYYNFVVRTFRDVECVDMISYKIGECFFYENDFRNAIKIFQKLIKDQPQSKLVPSSLFFLAECYIKLNEKDKAEDILFRLRSGYKKNYLSL